MKIIIILILLNCYGFPQKEFKITNMFNLKITDVEINEIINISKKSLSFPIKEIMIGRFSPIIGNDSLFVYILSEKKVGTSNDVYWQTGYIKVNYWQNYRLRNTAYIKQFDSEYNYFNFIKAWRFYIDSDTLDIINGWRRQDILHIENNVDYDIVHKLIGLIKNSKYKYLNENVDFCLKDYLKYFTAIEMRDEYYALSFESNSKSFVCVCYLDKDYLIIKRIDEYVY